MDNLIRGARATKIEGMSAGDTRRPGGGKGDLGERGERDSSRDGSEPRTEVAAEVDVDEDLDGRAGGVSRGTSDSSSGPGGGLSGRPDPFDDHIEGGAPSRPKSRRSASLKPEPTGERAQEPKRARERERAQEPKRAREREPRRAREQEQERAREPRRAREQDGPAGSDRDPPSGARRRFGFRRRDGRSRSEPRDDPGDRASRLSEELELSESDLADLEGLPEPRRFRRPPWWLLLGGALLVVVVALILYGEANSERYFLVCSGSRAVAHRGRGFPWPFGHSPMVGSAYRAVDLGEENQCQSQELDSEAELRQALLSLLLAEAQRLSLRTRSTDLARARRLLSQGRLLARGRKKDLERIRGLKVVLDFHQARVVMRELETTLKEARRLFARAAGASGGGPGVKASGKPGQRAKEAAAWVRLIDHMLDGLRRRLAGDPTSPRRVGPRETSTAPVPSKPAAPRADPRPRPANARPRPPGPAGSGAEPPRRRVSPSLPDAGVSGGGILL